MILGRPKHFVVLKKYAWILSKNSALVKFFMILMEYETKKIRVILTVKTSKILAQIRVKTS